MEDMKRKFVAFFTILLAFTLFLLPDASSHPGKTDANGGHYDRSTGEYHYHHGYEAHQHTDLDGDGVPDCPYDYDDRTGQNSGASSSAEKSYTYSSTVPTKQPEYITVVKTKEVPVEVIPQWVYYGFGACAAIFLIMCLAMNSRGKKIARLNAQLEEQKMEHEKDIIGTINAMEKRLSDAENSHRNELSQVRQVIIEEAREREQRIEAYRLKLEPTLSDEIAADLGSDYLLLLSSAPEGVTFDNFGLPHKAENGTDIFVFYLSSTGKYHRRSCYYATECRQIHALEIQAHPQRYRACQVCLPELPDMEWFVRYCSYRVLLERQNRKEIGP